MNENDRQALLPTPTCRDFRSGRASEATHAKNARPLNEVVTRSTGKALLKPPFVEWMMGFPIGWTESKP